MAPRGTIDSFEVPTSSFNPSLGNIEQVDLDNHLIRQRLEDDEVFTRGVLNVGKLSLRDPITEYREAERRGEGLLAYLRDPESAPTTPFLSFADLDKWGWKSRDMTAPATHGQLTQLIGKLHPVLEAKGLSTTTPPNTFVHWMHTRETVHHGVVYPGTNGNYRAVYNPEDGLVIATQSYSPEYEVHVRSNSRYALFPPGAPLPKLARWSDVVFLASQHLATNEEQLKGLKYIIRLGVINEQTKAVVEQALKEDGVNSGIPPNWPGHTFTFPTNGRSKGFEAVLGTPNCVGVAWSLFQHTEQLGKKMIKSITVFDQTQAWMPNNGSSLNIVLELADV